MSLVIIATLLIDDENNKQENVKRRILRDRSNPLELTNSAFIAQFRLNKAAFKYILDEVEPYMRSSSISPALQLAATLRSLAEGGYQRSVGQDANIALGRSTVSKLLTSMLKLLERKLCPKWIGMDLPQEEFNETKIKFFEKFRIPGIVVCIDGTHVKIMKPFNEENIYYNRKGYYSINVMIICDYKMKILALDACHPGSSHDSFIWNLSSVRQFFLTKYQAGERRSWLLGDGGYGIEPFLLMPYRDPVAGSVQHKFNLTHASARNVIERTTYQPQKVVKIVNVCSALHNICRVYNIDNNFEENNDFVEITVDFENASSIDNTMRNEGIRIRNDIENSL